jgi:hypothetical protein
MMSRIGVAALLISGRRLLPPRATTLKCLAHGGLWFWSFQDYDLEVAVAYLKQNILLTLYSIRTV